MATNENGHLIDDAGNVVIDHVWGNMPPQPNDVRIENGGTVLDEELSFHGRLLAGWNGYPLYTPNDAGETPPNLVVPSVVGLTATAATRILVDAGFNSANVSVAEADAYSQKIRRIGVTSGVAYMEFDSTTLLNWIKNAGTLQVGDTITITGLTDINGPTDVSGLNGTHTITEVVSNGALRFATSESDISLNFVVGNQNSNTSWVAFNSVANETVIAQTPAAGADNQTATSSVAVTALYTTDPDA